MDTLAAMRMFARVVEAGSFVRAAERQGVSTTAASRLIADLEAHLGARLLHRTTRRLHPTDAGRAYYERCAQILDEIDEAEADVRDETARPTGILRINAPFSFGIQHLGPLLPAYRAAYPEVDLDVSLSDRVVELVEEGFDLAIRISGQLPPTLVVRRLAPVHLVACAAPSYLARHGTPTTPTDLLQHNCLLYAYASDGADWRFDHIDSGEPITVRVSGNLRANNGDLLHTAAVAGEGVIRQPTFLLGDDLRSGALVPLLPDYSLPSLAVYAVYPTRRHLSAKVRTFVDFLASRWGDVPPWDTWR
jgi:DNA-binding transcriptional LysR family regulator